MSRTANSLRMPQSSSLGARAMSTIRVSSPTNRLESEANATASTTLGRGSQSARASIAQPDTVGLEHTSMPASLANRLQSLRGRGQLLPQSVREFFDGRLGVDFSGVRVHTDVGASELAGRLNARAFTIGQHIAFDREQYSAQTTSGRELLAHELVHVVQQAASPQNGEVLQRWSYSIATSFLRARGGDRNG